MRTFELVLDAPARQALKIDGGGQVAIDGAFFQVLVVNAGAKLLIFYTAKDINATGGKA
mgnify:CR=1 FL=1